MGDVTEGIIAGLIATIVTTIVMFAQQAAGIAPDFNLLELIQAAVGQDQVMAWIFHFVVGVVAWGGLFAVFSPHLPGPHWVRGLIFGTLTWLATMLAFLPAAGLGVFALGLGPEIPMMSLALNLIYGLVVGEAYHLLLHYMPGEVDENA